MGWNHKVDPIFNPTRFFSFRALSLECRPRPLEAFTMVKVHVFSRPPWSWVPKDIPSFISFLETFGKVTWIQKRRKGFSSIPSLKLTNIMAPVSYPHQNCWVSGKVYPSSGLPKHPWSSSRMDLKNDTKEQGVPPAVNPHCLGVLLPDIGERCDLNPPKFR